MSFTKKLTCEWANYGTVFQTANDLSLREQPITDASDILRSMKIAGKTDEMAHELSTSPTYITERYWVDQAAAEEWKTYLTDILSPACGIAILNIQITDI